MSQDQTDSSPELTLDAALARMVEYLRYLSGGVGFCEDRGFGWSLESEGWRREFIADWFTRLPDLQTLLPTMWARLQANQTIADDAPAMAEFAQLYASRK